MKKGKRRPEETEGHKKMIAAKGLKKEDRPVPKNAEEAARTIPWLGLYDATLPEKLIRHLSQGYSFESFGAEANVGKSTLYNWLEDHDEFKKAKETGESKGLRLYESIAVATATGRDIRSGAGDVQFNPKLANTGMIQFLMKTRFHKIYGEKKEVDHKSSDGSMKPNFVFEEVDASDKD